MDLNPLIHYLAKTYYSELLLFIVELTTIIIGLFTVWKEKAGKFFISYIAIDLTLMIYGWNNELTKSRYFLGISSYIIVNKIVAAAETAAYFYFFSATITNTRRKRVVTSLGLIYLGLIIVYFIFLSMISWQQLRYIGNILETLEFFIMLLPCLFFYTNFINTKSSTDILSRPSFWITTGIFLFSVISIPFYLIQYRILRSAFNSQLAAALYFTPIIINTLFLCKAFLCKRPLTT